MNTHSVNKARFHSIGTSRSRHGVGSLDLLVSFTLLITVMTVATPLVARHGKLLRSHRNYRLALDELSNQMERLTVLPLSGLPAAVEALSPSPFIAERLVGARLAGQLHPAGSGTRITLTLTWNDTERARAPVALSGWVFESEPPPATNSTEAQ